MGNLFSTFCRNPTCFLLRCIMEQNRVETDNCGQQLPKSPSQWDAETWIRQTIPSIGNELLYRVPVQWWCHKHCPTREHYVNCTLNTNTAKSYRLMRGKQQSVWTSGRAFMAVTRFMSLLLRKDRYYYYYNHERTLLAREHFMKLQHPRSLMQEMARITSSFSVSFQD